jgi:hypothetical protein
LLLLILLSLHHNPTRTTIMEVVSCLACSAVERGRPGPSGRPLDKASKALSSLSLSTRIIIACLERGPPMPMPPLFAFKPRTAKERCPHKQQGVGGSDWLGRVLDVHFQWPCKFSSEGLQWSPLAAMAARRGRGVPKPCLPARSRHNTTKPPRNPPQNLGAKHKCKEQVIS